MNFAQRLARKEIVRLKAYTPTPVGGALRLHANEAPWRHDWDRSPNGLNRDPDPHARSLRQRLADVYGQPPGRVLATRGSDDAIDALLRVFCRAGQDAVVVPSPGFEMYSVAARIQGASVIAHTLPVENDFALSPGALLAQAGENVKLVFVCTPNNPTATEIPASDVAALCAGLSERALLVVDEAYIEFSAARSASALLDRCENLVVLRTLSKAYALAGARCGAVLARSAVIDLLRCVLPPFLLPSPSQENACRALSADALAVSRRNIDAVIAERVRMARELERMPAVRRVYPSAANFLLIRVASADACVRKARAAGLALRDCTSWPALADCLRITIGTPEQNQRVLDVLRNLHEPVGSA